MFVRLSNDSLNIHTAKLIYVSNYVNNSFCGWKIRLSIEAFFGPYVGAILIRTLLADKSLSSK